MKKLSASWRIFALAFILIYFSAISANAQTPQAFNYQAIARDATGNELTNTSIDIRVSIRSTGTLGTIQWQETHAVTTNQFGLFTLVIGQGITTGAGAQTSFANIDWGSDVHFLQIEMDDGTGYVDMGTTQLMSVPYSLYAEKSGNVDDADADPSNELQAISISNDTIYLSNGGFVVLPLDQTADADADPTNELQAISISNDTIYLSNGGFVVLPPDQTADADADPTNELQAISISNDTIYLSNGGFVVLPPDQTADADADPTNELQTLSFANDTLNLSNGGSVALPYDSALWSKNGSDLYYNSGNVGIGTTSPNVSAKLEVNSTTSGLLLPRMTTTQRDAIISPVSGLMIYNTTTNCFNGWMDTAWYEMGCPPPPPSFFQTFTTSGTFTVPGSVTSVRVLVIGGGGGGANGHQGGGGSGYVATGTFGVTPGNNITVTVGTGGSGANECNGCNTITGNSAGTTSSFGGFLSESGGLTPTVVGQPGANGGSGGGGYCNAGSPGGTGGAGGANGGACTSAGGIGQGSYVASLSLFTENTLTAGTGGAGGTSSHSGGGGAGGILINSTGPAAGSGPQSWSGEGGSGHGAGGGGGGFDGGSGPMREAGGNGANGVVYIEW